MIENFPIEYFLESGMQVIVNKTGANTYEFHLKSNEEPGTQFTYMDDGRKKSEWDAVLSFEQLEALRKFWLKNEDVV